MKLSKISEILNISFNANDIEIEKLNSLDLAQSGELSYCDSVKHSSFLKNTCASVVMITKELINFIPQNTIALIHPNPHLAFAILSKYFAKELIRDKKRALVSDFAKVMDNVYIGSNSKIANNTLIMPGVYIGDDVNIGENCTIHPNVVIYNDTVIGDNVEIHANSVIGSDGFGYAHTNDGKHVKIYHNGNVIIEDNVEIGACTTIDRSVFKSTII
ncbi:MAG: UDP-3-O-(3-hydroxymyristoyl)glucosamine N-acyltransferase, partial [Campylobacter sp.]|nr:UDP-3-O-(3-hydroxymyristoyl)glucosamine N-acyltransferase [Campylobacter sp.]